MTAAADTLLALYGTEQPLRGARLLKAGPLSCVWCDGELRQLSWHGVEVLRGVAYLLRDANWATVPAQVHDLRCDEGDHAFQLQCSLHMSLGTAVLKADLQLQGRADGLVELVVTAEPDAELLSARCGLVLLHPSDCAGRPLTVTHTDGRRVASGFPALISPGQPVFDIRGLGWAPTAGVQADLRLEADLPDRPATCFEMEDQRNWSDASFKTYVGSLLHPWPYRLPAGQALRQAMRLWLSGRPQAAPPDAGSQVRIVARPGAQVPPLGLGVPHLQAPPGAAERAATLALQPAWLVAQVDLGRADAAAHLCTLADLAQAAGAQVQLDALCPDGLAPAAAAQRLQQLCQAARLLPAAVRLCPSAYLVSYQPTDVWPELPALEHFAAAARAAFPAARTGGGMVTNFTELNRKRQSPAGLDFIGHGNCPIVHAADEASVMQTLQALPAIAATVRAVWPGLGWRLGPLALAAARNPYGQAPVPNPQRHRLPLAAVDPRHGAQFGAAWLAATFATVAPLAPELLSLLDSHGPSGPCPAAGDGAEPVPAWGVWRRLAAWCGSPLGELTHLPAGVCGLAARHGSQWQLMLVNLGPEPVEVLLAHPVMPDLSGDGGPVQSACRLGPYAVTWWRSTVPAAH